METLQGLVIATTEASVRTQPGSTIAQPASMGMLALVREGPTQVGDTNWYTVRGGWIAQTDEDGAICWALPADYQQPMMTDRPFALAVQCIWQESPGYGLSQRTFPYIDILKLSREQALFVYYRAYWLASGAAYLFDPLLQRIHFDAAVAHGVGIARQWLKESEKSLGYYLAIRLRWYTRQPPQAQPVGWLDHLATLLDTTV